MGESFAASQVNPAELAIAQILEIAKTTGRDEFKVRVNQRRTGQMYPGVVAAFEDASSGQIAHPESWLVQLGGGGLYQLQVYHATDPAKPIGTPIPVQVTGTSREMTPEALHALVRDSDWPGPRTLAFPPIAKKQPAANGANFDPFLRTGAMSVAPGSTAGNGASQAAGAAGGAPVSSDPAVASTLAELQRERAAVAQLQSELQRQREAANEERHRNELEAERKRQELEMQKLRSELLSQRPASNPAAEMTPLITTLAQMQQAQSSQFQALMLELSKQNQAQLAQVQETNKTLLMELVKKPGIDPLMEKLLSKNEEASMATVKVVSQMAEATGSVVNMMVGALHSLKELGSSGEEGDPTWLKVTREVVAGLAAMQPQVSMPQLAPAPAPAPRPPAPPRRQPAPRVVAPAGAPVPAAAAPPPAAFDGLEESAFGQVVKAILEQQDVRLIANFFIDNAEDPSIQGPLQAAGMNPLVAFSNVPALAQWLQADQANRMPYVHSLIQAVQTVYEKRQADGTLPGAGYEEEEEEEAGAGEDGEQPQASA